MSPLLAMLAIGVLIGAFAVNAVTSLALIVLAATLLTAAALAPVILERRQSDWASRLIAWLSGRLAQLSPAFALRFERDTRRCLFACLAGLNLAVFAAIFLRAGA
ncbi:MAG: hypothetical protein AAGJ91_15295 [Pseudomonadota bacterium]